MAGRDKKAKPPSKDIFEAQLSSALRFRAKFGREERWKRYIKRLAHVYYTDTQVESPTINIMAARIRALVPQLALGMPSVKVESYMRPGDPNSEPALAKILEMLWRSEKMDAETRRVTLDSETFGIGIGFVGYEAAFGSDVLSRTRKLFGIMPEPLTEKLSTWTGGATDGLSTETVEAVKRFMSERAFLTRTSPLNFIIDPTADHFTNATYMGRRLFLTQEQADAISKGSFKPDSVGNVSEHDTSNGLDPFTTKEPGELQNIIENEVRRCIVWELWDITRKKTVYLDRTGKVPKDDCVKEWRSTHSGFPFVPMLWDDVPDCVYPEGLATGLEPLSNELHLIRKRQLQVLRQGIRKYVSNGPLTAKARQAVKSDVDSEIVELGETDELQPMQWNPIPADMFSVEARVKADMDEVSATSHMQAAGAAQIRKTATESAFIQASADAMMSYRQLMVEEFTQNVMEILLSIVTSLFDSPIPLKIINADPELPDSQTGMPLELGDTIEYSFVGIDHKGLYRITIEPGSMVAQAKDVERQHLLAIREAMSPMPYFNVKAFDMLILSTMPSIRDASRYILTGEQIGGGVPGQPAGMQPGVPPQEAPGSSPAAAPSIPAFGEVNASAEGDVLSAMFGQVAAGGPGGV